MFSSGEPFHSTKGRFNHHFLPDDQLIFSLFLESKSQTLNWLRATTSLKASKNTFCVNSQVLTYWGSRHRVQRIHFVSNLKPWLHESHATEALRHASLIPDLSKIRFFKASAFEACFLIVCKVFYGFLVYFRNILTFENKIKFGDTK